MIYIDDKTQCSGCEACAQICPKRCIAMTADSEGFLYPKADEALCIHCDLCDKICPVKNAEEKGDAVRAAYAAYAKDDALRLKSSSGGVFGLCARWVLAQGGVVFGAAFDERGLLRHRAAEMLEELEPLLGSKYVQSSTGDSFRQAKQLLTAGKPVLFAGTACQTAGLAAFLGREYETLVTLDVLCHGVPSPKVWERYTTEQQQKHDSAVTGISFRQKKRGWKDYRTELRFANGRVREKSFRKDPYMRLFLQNLSLRPSCHACRFKALERPSDLTLGDCWGIESWMPEMDDDRGTSMIFVHSEKGARLLAKIAPELRLQAGEADRLLPPTSDSRRSAVPHPNREIFFLRFAEGQSIERLAGLAPVPLFRRILDSAAELVHLAKKRVIR